MLTIMVSIAYRWFLGYTLNEELPHFSTVSYNFKHRFTEETVEQVFSWILQEANYAGYLEPEAVFVDGTHIKANANINKKIKKAVPQAAKRYASELMEEVNADREDHGKKPFDSTPKPPKEKEIMVSKTDPESGLFQKGEHKKCFAYEAHTACDKHNFVLDVEVTPGNVHDSVAFEHYCHQSLSAWKKGCIIEIVRITQNCGVAFCATPQFFLVNQATSFDSAFFLNPPFLE
jgi:hypothetical protein